MASEDKKEPRFFITKNFVKQMLSSLGLAAEPEALGQLVKLSQTELAKFGKAVGDAVAKDGRTKVDRDVIPGDKGSVSLATFPTTPFYRALKSALKSAAKGESKYILPKETVARAAAVFQNQLNNAFRAVAAKEGNMKRGDRTMITVAGLGGAASERHKEWMKKQKEKKASREAKRNGKAQLENKDEEEDEKPKKEKKQSKKRKSSEDDEEESPKEKKKEKVAWEDAVPIKKPKKGPSRKEVLKHAITIENETLPEKEPIRASKIRRRQKKPSMADQLAAVQAELAKMKSGASENKVAEKPASNGKATT